MIIAPLTCRTVLKGDISLARYLCRSSASRVKSDASAKFAVQILVSRYYLPNGATELIRKAQSFLSSSHH